MTRKNFAFVFLFFAATEFSAAQNLFADSVKMISEIIVVSNRAENFSTGSKIESLDSLTQIIYDNRSLAEILSMQNFLFIKSYGPGALASTSFRGAGAEQTAVLWNGFNLQSPMNGQLDLSILQNDFDEIKIQYGNASALFGSGAVGGNIQLNSKPKFESGFHSAVNFQAGSFENYRENISLSYGGKYFFGSLKIFNQNAKNDFSFTNNFLAGNPTVNQTNAAFNQSGILSDNYFLVTKNQQLNFHFWYQGANRQIPPPMSVQQSLATQLDKSLRLSAEWSLKKKSNSFFVRSAWFDEKLNYIDSVSGIISNNRTRTNISEVESRTKISKYSSLNVGLNNTFTSANVDAYGKSISQNRSAIFLLYKVSFTEKFFVNANIREEIFNGNVVPLMPSVGAEWKINNHIKIFGNAGRTYRLPTLNELYWTPGGDLNLKPEQGWAEEISFNVKKNINFFDADFTTTFFNRVIDDWIQWVPAGSYWSPKNILRVWSRGIEGNMKLILPAEKWNFIYNGKVNYILSTNEKTDNPNDASLHQQLIYVPRLNYMNSLSATHKTFFASFSQTYTGIRFTQSDNSNFLLYYLLGNFSIGNEFLLQSYRFLISFQINNIWNGSYQVVENYPMPGRNFLVALTFKI